MVAAAAARRARAPDQEVGIALPAVHDEVGLVDHGRPGLHRGERPLLPGRVLPGDLDQPRLPLPQAHEIAVLVLLAFPRGKGALVVLVGRGPLQLGGPGARSPAALGEHPLAPGGEIALEVRDEVARRVAEGTVGGMEHDFLVGGVPR